MWICKHCSEQLEDTFDSCWSCGYSRDCSPPTETFESEQRAKAIGPAFKDRSGGRAWAAFAIGFFSWSQFPVAAAWPGPPVFQGGGENLYGAWVLTCILVVGFVLTGIGSILCHTRRRPASHRAVWVLASILNYGFLFGPVAYVVLAFLFTFAPVIGAILVLAAIFLIGRRIVRAAGASTRALRPPK